MNNFLTTIKVILMITILMIVIEYLELRYQEKIREKITGRPIVQYVVASLLGAIPGCMDAFFIVSLYIHGMVGFGALVSVMLSTAGDEAFIMLAMVPESALLIFVICVILGIAGGFLADKMIELLNVKRREHCQIEIHEEETTPHFMKEHVYSHILKEHVPRLFLWIFIPLTVFIATFNGSRFPFGSWAIVTFFQDLDNIVQVDTKMSNFLIRGTRRSNLFALPFWV